MLAERCSRLLDRTWFPPAGDPSLEARKLAVLRIATGFLVAWRNGAIALDARYFFEPTVLGGHSIQVQAACALVECLLGVGLAVGVLPRTCAGVLLFTHAWFSAWTGTYNLGPMLLVPVFGAFAVLDTGCLALAVRPRRPAPAPLVRLVYATLFLAFAGWNLQALLLYHLQDPSWLGGRTFMIMCTNSYLGVFYRAFRGWCAFSPGTLLALSLAVVSLQTLFQAAMIPMMFTRWGARYVMVWGWVFALGSLLLLHLTLLPFVEIIYWAALFLPAGWFGWAGRNQPSGPVHGKPGQSRCAAAIPFLLCYQALLVLYYGNVILRRPQGSRIGDPLLVYAGLVAPDVFNKTDLRMGDRWAVVFRVAGGRREVVPFDGTDGSRLSFHGSDLLVFANSIQWRRSMIGCGDLAAYHSPGHPGFAFASQIARFDYRRRGSTGSGEYLVTIYGSDATDAAAGLQTAGFEGTPATSFTLVVGR